MSSAMPSPDRFEEEYLRFMSRYYLDLHVLAEVFGDHLITFDARFRTVASAARSVAESVLPLITELAAFGQAQWPDPDCLPKIFKKYSQRMMDAHVAFAKVYADGVFGGIGVAPMVLSTISDDPDPSDAAATKGTAIRCHSWDLFDFMSLPVCHLVEQELCWQDQPSPFSADILRAITPAADAVVTAASHSMSTMILDGLSLKFRLQPRSTFVNHSRHFLRASGPDPVLADVFVFSDSIVIFEANAPRKLVTVREISDSVVTYDAVANTVVVDSLTDVSEPSLIVLGFAHQDLSILKSIVDSCASGRIDYKLPHSLNMNQRRKLLNTYFQTARDTVLAPSASSAARGYASVVLSAVIVDPVDLLLKPPPDILDTAPFATRQQANERWVDVVLTAFRCGGLPGSVLQRRSGGLLRRSQSGYYVLKLARYSFSVNAVIEEWPTVDAFHAWEFSGGDSAALCVSHSLIGLSYVRLKSDGKFEVICDNRLELQAKDEDTAKQWVLSIAAIRALIQRVLSIGLRSEADLSRSVSDNKGLEYFKKLGKVAPKKRAETLQPQKPPPIVEPLPAVIAKPKPPPKKPPKPGQSFLSAVSAAVSAAAPTSSADSATASTANVTVAADTHSMPASVDTPASVLVPTIVTIETSPSPVPVQIIAPEPVTISHVDPPTLPTGENSVTVASPEHSPEHVVDTKRLSIRTTVPSQRQPSIVASEPAQPVLATPQVSLRKSLSMLSKDSGASQDNDTDEPSQPETLKRPASMITMKRWENVRSVVSTGLVGGKTPDQCDELLRWYCDSGFGFAAKSLLDAMSVNGVDVYPATYPPIITLLCWQGLIDAADKLISISDHIPAPDVVTALEQLLSSCATAGVPIHTLRCCGMLTDTLTKPHRRRDIALASARSGFVPAEIVAAVNGTQYVADYLMELGQYSVVQVVLASLIDKPFAVSVQSLSSDALSLLCRMMTWLTDRNRFVDAVTLWLSRVRLSDALPLDVSESVLPVVCLPFVEACVQKSLFSEQNYFEIRACLQAMLAICTTHAQQSFTLQCVAMVLHGALGDFEELKRAYDAAQATVLAVSLEQKVSRIQMTSSLTDWAIDAFSLCGYHERWRSLAAQALSTEESISNRVRATANTYHRIVRAHLRLREYDSLYSVLFHSANNAVTLSVATITSVVHACQEAGLSNLLLHTCEALHDPFRLVVPLALDDSYAFTLTSAVVIARANSEEIDAACRWLSAIASLKRLSGAVLSVEAIETLAHACFSCASAMVHRGLSTSTSDPSPAETLVFEWLATLQSIATDVNRHLNAVGHSSGLVLSSLTANWVTATLEVLVLSRARQGDVDGAVTSLIGAASHIESLVIYCAELCGSPYIACLRGLSSAHVDSAVLMSSFHRLVKSLGKAFQLTSASIAAGIDAFTAVGDVAGAFAFRNTAVSLAAGLGLLPGQLLALQCADEVTVALLRCVTAEGLGGEVLSLWQAHFDARKAAGAFPSLTVCNEAIRSFGVCIGRSNEKMTLLATSLSRSGSGASNVTWSSVEQDIARIRQLVCDMIAADVMPDAFTVAALASAYCSGGLSSEGRLLLLQLIAAMSDKVLTNSDWSSIAPQWKATPAADDKPSDDVVQRVEALQSAGMAGARTRASTVVQDIELDASGVGLVGSGFLLANIDNVNRVVASGAAQTPITNASAAVVLLACGRLGLQSAISDVLQCLVAQGLTPDRHVLRACYIATAQCRNVVAADAVTTFPCFYPSASTRLDGFGVSSHSDQVGGMTGDCIPAGGGVGGKLFTGFNCATEHSLRIVALLSHGEIEEALSAAEVCSGAGVVVTPDAVSALLYSIGRLPAKKLHRPSLDSDQVVDVSNHIITRLESLVKLWVLSGWRLRTLDVVHVIRCYFNCGEYALAEAFATASMAACCDATVTGQWPVLFDGSLWSREMHTILRVWGGLPPADVSTLNGLLWGYTQVPLRFYAPTDEQWLVNSEKLAAVETVALSCKLIPDDVTLGLLESCRKRVASRARIVEIQQTAAISKTPHRLRPSEDDVVSPASQVNDSGASLLYQPDHLQRMIARLWSFIVGDASSSPAPQLTAVSVKTLMGSVGCWTKQRPRKGAVAEWRSCVQKALRKSEPVCEYSDDEADDDETEPQVLSPLPRSESRSTRKISIVSAVSDRVVSPTLGASASRVRAESYSVPPTPSASTNLLSMLFADEDEPLPAHVMTRSRNNSVQSMPGTRTMRSGSTLSRQFDATTPLDAALGRRESAASVVDSRRLSHKSSAPQNDLSRVSSRVDVGQLIANSSRSVADASVLIRGSSRSLLMPSPGGFGLPQMFGTPVALSPTHNFATIVAARNAALSQAEIDAAVKDIEAEVVGIHTELDALARSIAERQVQLDAVASEEAGLKHKLGRLTDNIPDELEDSLPIDLEFNTAIRKARATRLAHIKQALGDLEAEQEKLLEELSASEKAEAKAMYVAFTASQRRLTEEETHEQAVLSDAQADLAAAVTFRDAHVDPMVGVAVGGSRNRGMIEWQTKRGIEELKRRAKAEVEAQNNFADATVHATSKLLQRTAAVVIQRDSSLRKLESKFREAIPKVSEAITSRSSHSNDVGALKARISALAADTRHSIAVLQSYKRRALADLEALSVKRSKDASLLLGMELQRAVEDENREGVRIVDEEEKSISRQLEAINRSVREKMAEARSMLQSTMHEELDELLQREDEAAVTARQRLNQLREEYATLTGVTIPERDVNALVSEEDRQDLRHALVNMTDGVDGQASGFAALLRGYDELFLGGDVWYSDVQHTIEAAVPFFLRQNVMDHIVSALLVEVDRVRALPAKRAVDKLASKLLPTPMPSSVHAFVPLNPVPRKAATMTSDAILERLLSEPEPASVSVTPPRAHSRQPSETGSDSKQRGKSVGKAPAKPSPVDQSASAAEMLSFYKSPSVGSKAVTHSLVSMAATAAAAVRVKTTSSSRTQSKFAALLEPVSLPATAEKPRKVTLDDVTVKAKK